MSILDNVIQELTDDGRLLNMTNDEILNICNERSQQREKELDELEIPGVPESSCSAFAKYAIDHGYDEDDFMDLVNVKILRHFPC